MKFFKKNYSTIVLLMLNLFAENTFSHTSDQKCVNSHMSQIVAQAKKEINDRMYLTLATVDKSASPWNAPVYSAFDQRYYFYWMSAVLSQHSKNIRANGKVFSVIYDSKAKEGTGFGVYMRGQARELGSNDLAAINHGIAIMGGRIHRTDLPSAKNYLAPFPRRVYQFIPSQIWVNTIVEIEGKKVDQRLDITRCFLATRNHFS